MHQTGINNDCDFVRKNLFSYREQRLTDMEKAMFDEHLRTCRRCAEIFQSFESGLLEISRKRTESPDPFILTRISQQMETMQLPEKPRLAFLLLKPVQVASLVLLIAFSSLVGFSLAKTALLRVRHSAEHQAVIQELQSEFEIREMTDSGDELLINR
jgi:hypothetical protein